MVGKTIQIDTETLFFACLNSETAKTKGKKS